jgi:hypothetical protein
MFQGEGIVQRTPGVGRGSQWLTIPKTMRGWPLCQDHPADVLSGRHRRPPDTHDRGPGGLHLPRHRADRRTTPSAAARHPAQACDRTSFPPPWHAPGRTASARSASRARGAPPPRSHPSLPWQPGSSDRRRPAPVAVNANAHLGQSANRRLDIDRVAAQAIQLRHHQHVVAFQPVKQLHEAGTLLDRGRA